LSIVIFGVKFSELEILKHKFYFFISFFINYFSNTLSCIQQDLNNLEKIVTMISIKVIINVLVLVFWEKMHIIT
jgi:cytosine/uracil/thiamine/allantoin permease